MRKEEKNVPELITRNRTYKKLFYVYLLGRLKTRVNGISINAIQEYASQARTRHGESILMCL